MITPVVNPWLGMTIVLAVLSGLLGGLRLYQCACTPQPEVVRKLFHLGGGLTTLALPWLFAHAWPVLALAGLTILGLFMLSHVGAFKDGLGGVLCGVARYSRGEIYFPLGVSLVFVLARGDALLFSIPMLILTLADPAAALVGMRYGRWHYAATASAKSAEGSMAFFIVAFVSVHIPLLLWTNMNGAETLRIALLVTLLSTLVEAVARGGMDNLLVPLASCILLRAFLAMGMGGLAPCDMF